MVLDYCGVSRQYNNSIIFTSIFPVKDMILIIEGLENIQVTEMACYCRVPSDDDSHAVTLDGLIAKLLKLKL